MDHGYSPLGKYSCARDSILDYLVSSDWGNESSGNTESPTGWFARIANDPADVAMNNGEFNSVLEEWKEWNQEVTDSEALRMELVGHFIVQTMDSGFVYVYAYETEQELMIAYAQLEREFSTWDEQEEGDD